MSYFGKISTREHYGLRLAIWLAQTYSKKPITLSQIGQHERISVKYLEQLIVPFRRARWVKSLRGRSGGYQMIKNPTRLTLLDVMNLISDKARVVDCLTSACPLENCCPSKTAWQKVQTALDDALQKIKLSQLIKP
ncbi:MAG: Rrf2 family transcriptional regulator [Patescibacteria group bacterium]|nr:Rrf2 family transcriptional regulator [Patescibacteria group bacterium]